MSFGDVLSGLGIAGDLAGIALQGSYNAREASKSRGWSEQMSGTAHQREVADLRAAGLNPVLSANHGGASTPSGPTASISAPSISGAVNSARAVSQQKDLINAQIRQANSVTGLNLANTAVAAQSARRARVDADAAEFLGGDLKGAAGAVHSARGVAEAGGSLWDTVKRASKSAAKYGRALMSTK